MRSERVFLTYASIASSVLLGEVTSRLGSGNSGASPYVEQPSIHPSFLHPIMTDSASHLPARRTAMRRGFTLIEILVVIVVIAILASMVAPNVFKHVGSAKDATARSQIEMLGAALDAYRLDNGTYPTTEQGLEALTEAPTNPAASNWRGPYLRKALPGDPWRNPYVYVFPGEQNPNGYDLMSLGADGQVGGEGENEDIVSWK
jgi:general secretion pathway protein G